VSGDNLATVRAMWAAWTGEDMSDWLEFFDPEIAWHTRDDEPDAGVYRGRAGVEELMEFWSDNFDDLGVDAEEFIAHGEHVIVPGRVRGTGKSSGAAVELPYTFLYTVRGGRIVEVREFTSKANAFGALRQEEHASK
jgi:ketosteroid isomerase-like protein